MWQVRKKTCTEVRDIKFISKQTHQFFVFTFLSVQFKFSVHFIHSCLLCCLIAFPPHPFAYNFFLFMVICFKLPITRTFFKFPRFEFSGVDSVATIMKKQAYLLVLSSSERVRDENFSTQLKSRDFKAVLMSKIKEMTHEFQCSVEG